MRVQPAGIHPVEGASADGKLRERPDRPTTAAANSGFRIAFSEEPFSGFSYKIAAGRPCVHGGGRQGNRRAAVGQPGSNIGWEIVVEPDSNGDVTIVLPATTDCNAQGAICTGDGRPLSNRLEITVSGPGG